MKKQKNLNLFVKYTLIVLVFVISGCATRGTVNTSDVFLKGSVVSCGHLIIYQLSEDNKSYIQVIIDTKEIELDRENTWSMSSENESVTVRFRQFEESVVSRLCNDVGGRRKKPSKEVQATIGDLTISMTEADWKDYKSGRRYKVDLNAEGLKFDDETTYALSISQTTVGWLPG